jgi:O-antigen/teichoic acid export membrane protein
MRLRPPQGPPSAAGEPGGGPLAAVFAGGLWILVADSLFIPTALAVAAFLARRLGPADYGRYVVAAAIGGWIEWTLSSVVSRAAIRQVAASADWRPAGRAVARVLLVLGTATGLALFALAGPIASALGDASLAPLLRVTAPGLPIIGLLLAHRFILVSLERFRSRAGAGALRWLVRLGLVIALVDAGFGAIGATAAAVGAAAAELVLLRRFVQPQIVSGGPAPWRAMCRMAVPLFAAGISMRAFEKLDLICLQAFGGRSPQSGLYGAAQNLSMLPGFVTVAFSPVLLASMTRLVAANRHVEMRHLARQALRGGLWLAPLAAVLAGAADPLVALLYGPVYRETAPLLAVLCIGSVAQAMVGIESSLLVSMERVKTAAALAVPLVPVALVAHALVIPRFGALGAAVVTSSTASLAAAAGIFVVGRATGAWPPLWSVARVVGLTAAGWALAAVVPGDGLLLPSRLALTLGILFGAALLFGEVDLAAVRSLKSRPGGVARVG